MTEAGGSNLPPESRYRNCIRCGLCLAVCPTYRTALNETASPRGRVALAYKGLEHELDLTPNLIEQMYSCFDCLACSEICPVGIRPGDLALELRRVQEQLQPRRWKQGLFGGLMAKAGRLELASLPLRLYQTLGPRRLVYALGLVGRMPSRLRDLEAMLPHLPQRPLRQVLPELTPAQGESHHRVAFFLGCAQSLLFAGQSAATLRVLAHNGCTVITPKDVECCGMPARAYGREDLAVEQARHNIAEFERAEVEWVLTDCATCGATLKDYGARLACDGEWAARAAAFSRKVRDISEFLVELPLEKPPVRLDIRVTYHDPCHLRRGQGVWRQPRALLRMIEGVELTELPEADWCCGSAGSQLITHYQTSLSVLQRKMDHVASTQAGYVASGCPACRMQLQVGAKRRGLELQVVHPVELLDQAYGGQRQGC